MTRRTILISTAIAIVVAIGLLGPVAYRAIELRVVGGHQRSVMRELAELEAEHSHVTSWPEADRAISVLEFIHEYYVPSEGYRSDPETEGALGSQRARTVAAIVAGLRSFSGEDFGSDVKRWKQWAKERPPRREVK